MFISDHSKTFRTFLKVNVPVLRQINWNQRCVIIQSDICFWKKELELFQRIRVIPGLLMYNYKGIHFLSRSLWHLTRTYINGLNSGYLIIVGRTIFCFFYWAVDLSIYLISWIAISTWAWTVLHYRTKAVQLVFTNYIRIQNIICVMNLWIGSRILTCYPYFPMH